jgi:hypothetical protein
MEGLWRICLLLVSLGMGIAEFYTLRIGWHPSSYDWNRTALTHLSDIPGILGFSVLTAVILYVLISRLKDIPLIRWRVGPSGHVTDAPFAALTLFLFLCWLPFFAVFYPGTGMNDTTDILRAGVWAAGQHTLVYCLFISGLGEASYQLTGTAAYGIAAASLIQMGLFAIIISYALSWLYQRTGRMTLSLIGGLYYGLTPMIVNMSFSNVKDVIFSGVILLWVPLLCEFFMQPPEEAWENNHTLFIVASLGMMLLRNNGYYVYLVLIVFLILLAGRIRFRVALTGLLLLLACLMPNLILKETLDLPQLFQERVGIPLQQVGRTVALEMPLSPDEEQYINRIMTKSIMAEDYDPFTADNIKWNSMFDFYYFNNHSDEFFSTWKSLGKKYPQVYLDAWMLATYGYWAFPAPDEMTQSRFTWAFSEEEMTEGMNPIHNNAYRTAVMKKAFPDKVQKAMGDYLHDHSRYLGGGTCFWILMIIGLLLLRRKQYNRLIVLLPGALLWASLMVATPAAFVFRYVYYFPLCMPFYLLLPFLPEGKYGITHWKEETLHGDGWTHWKEDGNTMEGGGF